MRARRRWDVRTATTRWTFVGVTGLGLVLTAASCTGQAATTRRQTSSTTSSTVPGAPSAKGFQPVAMSFIDPDQGWAIGTRTCPSLPPRASGPGVCSQMLTTKDGGKTWTNLAVVPEPLSEYTNPALITSAVGDIYFADAEDGFLFSPGLQVTTNDFQSWGPGPAPWVSQVVSADGNAFALSQQSAFTEGGGTSLWHTLGSDAWSPVAMPPVNPNLHTKDQLAAEGSTLLFLQTGITGPGRTFSDVGGLWSSTDGGQSWAGGTVPCTVGDGGAALVSIAFGHPDSWLVDCYDNRQSSQEQATQHHLYGTDNGGASWVRLSDPARSGAPALMADNGAGHAFLVTVGVRDQFVGTFDGGRTWKTIPTAPGSFARWADLDFVTESVGFVVGPVTSTGPNYAYRTDDGGHTWKAIDFGR